MPEFAGPPDKAPANHKPRLLPNAPISPHDADVVQVTTDDPMMNFERKGRAYRTHDGRAFMPRKDAEYIAANVPGVRIRPTMAGGFGPGTTVNGRPRHEYFPGDCACEECQRG